MSSASLSIAEEKYQEFVSLINSMKQTKALRTIFNSITKNGVQVFTIDDYEVLIEPHYDYSCLYVSLLFEPQDFSQRKCLKSVSINK